MVENFATMEEVNALIRDFPNGYVIHIDEGDKTLVRQDGEWKEVNGTTASGGLNMSLYELNKSVINQLPEFNDEAWRGAAQVVTDFLEGKSNGYYMLYGRELNYFTVFRATPDSENLEFHNLFEAIKACVESVGTVKSFDIDPGKMSCEIWLTPKGTDGVVCMYLFPYDDGVVKYGC